MNPFLELEKQETRSLRPHLKQEVMSQIRLINHLTKIAILFTIDAGKTMVSGPD